MAKEEIREGLRDLLLRIHITPELTIDDLTDDVLKYFNDKVVVKGNIEAVGEDERGYQVSCYTVEPLIEESR